MTNKIGKKRKITFWTRLGFGMGGCSIPVP